MKHPSKAMGGQVPAERELIERARRGQRNAQQELWQMHRRWVAAIVMVHRPRAMEVDDLMQDVAIKFISKVQTLRDAEAFRPWLRRIVINVCRGAARGLRPALRLADERGAPADAALASDSLAVATDSGPEEVTACRETAVRLLDHVQTLPSDYREPLILRCVRSMSYQQISDILQLPITTIETRLARARRMLREEIAGQTLPRRSP